MANGKRMLVTLGTAAAGWLLLTRADAVEKGVEVGLRLCLQSVIPSLFLFMILGNFLAAVDLSPVLFWPARLLCRLFRVPGEAAPVLVVALLGGYPAGALMIGQMVRQGRLGRKTGEKLLCSCVCCSPAFLTGAVGWQLFRSVHLGLLLWGCQGVAFLLTGLLASRILPADGGDGRKRAGSSDYGDCLVKAVAGAVRSLGIICGMVLLFSVVNTLLGDIGPAAGLLEVTVGCAGLRDSSFLRAVTLSVVYTSFGGLCVWMQVVAFLRGSGVSCGKALLFRGPYCFFSLALSLLTVRLIRVTAPVFSSFAEPLPAQGSPTLTASVFLVLLCLMLLLSLPALCYNVTAGSRNRQN